MLISSKGRYALKLMIYIAAIGGDPVGESISADAVSREALAPRPNVRAFPSSTWSSSCARS